MEYFGVIFSLRYNEDKWNSDACESGHRHLGLGHEIKDLLVFQNVRALFNKIPEFDTSYYWAHVINVAWCGLNIEKFSSNNVTKLVELKFSFHVKTTTRPGSFFPFSFLKQRA